MAGFPSPAGDTSTATSESAMTSIARSHLLGVDRAPDVPLLPVRLAVQVDGLVREEVDRADDVVPGAAVEQVRDAVLAPQQEIGLDPHAQPGVAQEVAVLVEVV